MSQAEQNENTDLVKSEGGGANVPAPNINFMDISDVSVQLVYNIPKVGRFEIEFPALRLLMNNEEISARQKFFGQPAEKQLLGRHAYNVTLLSKLANTENPTPPVGLPGFEEYLINQTAENEGDRLEKALYKYLINPKPMNVKVAEDALNKYTTATSDEDFFR